MCARVVYARGWVCWSMDVPKHLLSPSCRPWGSSCPRPVAASLLPFAFRLGLGQHKRVIALELGIAKWEKSYGYFVPQVMGFCMPGSGIPDCRCISLKPGICGVEKLLHSLSFPKLILVSLEYR